MRCAVPNVDPASAQVDDAFLDTLAREVRYALQALRHNPAFTIVAVLTLAVGIGANTVIFSFLDAVLLRSLPVKDPHRLVKLGAGHRRAARPARRA